MSAEESKKKIVIYSDGGARGNPGPAAIGAVVTYGKKKWQLAECIGEATNNVAEYTAILEALEKAKKEVANAKEKEVDCYLDSELLVKQLKKEYKVKDENLGKLFLKVNNAMADFSRVNFFHVKREYNKEADGLVNMALGKKK